MEFGKTFGDPDRGRVTKQKCIQNSARGGRVVMAVKYLVGLEVVRQEAQRVMVSGGGWMGGRGGETGGPEGDGVWGWLDGGRGGEAGGPEGDGV